MSRKRSQSREKEQREWLERRQREREAAAQRSEAAYQPVPGFKRLTLDED